MKPPRQALGAEGEAVASAALSRAGYRILEANLRTPFGEIDLLAQQGDTLCFVEVKTRSSDAFGHPAEAVTPAKQGRMRKAAAFLIQRRLWDGPCRFDVVAVTRELDGSLKTEIIPDAFQ